MLRPDFRFAVASRLLNSATARRVAAYRKHHVSSEILEDRQMLAAATLVKDVKPGSAGGVGRELTNVNGTLFFTSSNASGGGALWKSDGTEAGTVLVKDVTVGFGADFRYMTSSNGRLYFTANSDASGKPRLWTSDGTETGTVRIREDLIAGPLEAFGGLLYFAASDGITGGELWRTDGTEAGTVRISDVRPGAESSFVENLKAADGSLFFQVNGRELWKSDGTQAGTVLVKELGASPYRMTNVGGRVFFAARDNNTGNELWTSDGTAAGTRRLKDINPTPFESSYPDALTEANGKLYFQANDGVHGIELWTSDGTAAGTVLLKDIAPPEDFGSSPMFFTEFKGQVYFSASGVLYKSNGTAAGTVTVHDESFRDAFGPTELRVFGGELYFVGSRSIVGDRELWKTNGVNGGTVRVADINPGTASSDPRYLVEVDGALYFIANDGVHGGELWKYSSNNPIVTVNPNVAWSEATPPVLIGADAVVTDSDSPTFPGGRLTIRLTAGALATDRVAILSQGIGPGEISLSGSSVRFGGVAIGTFSGGTGATPLIVNLNANATPAAVQALLRRIAFQNTSASPGTQRTISVSLRDEFGGKAVAAITVNITEFANPPVITLATTPVTYRENDPQLLIAGGAAISDADSLSFAVGKLTVTLLSGGETSDRLRIVPQGNGAGQISLSGNRIRYEGDIIGEFTGGDGTTPLVITFSALATRISAQATLRRISFINLSENPSTLDRVAQFQVTDGHGGTSAAVQRTIRVVSVNDPPSISVNSPGVYTENNPATLVFAQGTVSDIDAVNFAGGKLIVKYASGGEGTDRLSVLHQGTAAGQVGVAGSNITFGGTVVGTFSGGAGNSTFTVAFNSAATVAAVQAVLRRIAYQSLSDNPLAEKQLSLHVTDGAGGSSAIALKTMNITRTVDHPALNVGASEVTYRENAAPVLVAGAALLTDPDSLAFGGGRLTVSYASGAEGTDSLKFLHQGTNAGQIGVTGNTLSYGGTVIGTIAGGTSGSTLTVDFNASALRAAVQAAIRRLAFQNTSENPGSQQRILQFVLTDGGGGTSAAVQKRVNVVPVNDAPTLGVGDPITYTPGGPPLILAGDAPVVDVDSPNFGGGRLTVRYTSGGAASDRLSILSDTGSSPRIVVSGNEVREFGILIATFAGGSGTTPLVVSFNASATPASAQALLRRIAFHNVSGSPPAQDRILSFQLTDGDGGTSLLASETVRINETAGDATFARFESWAAAVP